MTFPQSNDLRAKLAEIVSTILDIPFESVTDDLSPKTCEAWDSLRHLTLVLATEDAFGITVAESEIMSLMSFASLRDAVAVKVLDRSQ